MAAKNTLKYKRNRRCPSLDVIDAAIEHCLRVLGSPDYKGTISDLIRIIRLQIQLNPIAPAPT